MASFNLFDQLPFELRTTIWEYALSGPHIVRVKFKADGSATLSCTHAQSRTVQLRG
jgi:hypothetical protein